MNHTSRKVPLVSRFSCREVVNDNLVYYTVPLDTGHANVWPELDHLCKSRSWSTTSPCKATLGDRCWLAICAMQTSWKRSLRSHGRESYTSSCSLHTRPPNLHINSGLRMASSHRNDGGRKMTCRLPIQVTLTNSNEPAISFNEALISKSPTSLSWKKNDPYTSNTLTLMCDGCRWLQQCTLCSLLNCLLRSLKNERWNTSMLDDLCWQFKATSLAIHTHTWQGQVGSERMTPGTLQRHTTT